MDERGRQRAALCEHYLLLSAMPGTSVIGCDLYWTQVRQKFPRTKGPPRNKKVGKHLHRHSHISTLYLILSITTSRLLTFRIHLGLPIYLFIAFIHKQRLIARKYWNRLCKEVGRRMTTMVVINSLYLGTVMETVGSYFAVPIEEKSQRIAGYDN